MGAILGARVLGEFGADPHWYVSAKAGKNYDATSPITRALGKKKVVAARFIHNDRLLDALMAWAFSSLRAPPPARSTTCSAPAESSTTTPCGWPAGSSASCTDA